MKESAVEWLFIQLTKIDYNCINKTFLQNNNSLAGHKLRELFEQAKEMEKQQAQNYVKFAIRCNGINLPILEFDGFVKL